VVLATLLQRWRLRLARGCVVYPLPLLTLTTSEMRVTLERIQ